MNNKLRLGLFAVSAIAVLSLAACKTADEAAPESAPAAEAAPAPQPAPSDTGMPPADTSMPTNASSTTPPATP